MADRPNVDVGVAIPLVATSLTACCPAVLVNVIPFFDLRHTYL